MIRVEVTAMNDVNFFPLQVYTAKKDGLSHFSLPELQLPWILATQVSKVAYFNPSLFTILKNAM